MPKIKLKGVDVPGILLFGFEEEDPNLERFCNLQWSLLS